MSEPVQTGKLDLTELDRALKEQSETAQDAKAAASVSDDGVKAHSLADHSETLKQAPADANQTAAEATAPATHGKVADSPATLSPISARSTSPSSAADAAPTAPSTISGGVSTDQTAQQQQQQPTESLPQPVQELKVMFPNYDSETIAAILASTGGDQEAAVNALLQMSDPNYKPPSAATNQTDSDALLAQTLAAEEEHSHQQRMLAQQQQQGSRARGGGGASSFFSELGSIIGGGGGSSPKPTTPTYDANNLSYQPRVRRNPVPQANRAAYATGPPSTSHTYDQSIVPGMPGPNEAKQWQEEINRMAETGLARAASTFSSLKQRAEAALTSSQTPGSGQTTPSGGPAAQGGGSFWRSQASGRGGGGASNYFQGFSSAFSPASAGGAGSNERSDTSRPSSYDRSVGSVASPKSPQIGEYDRDPSPVGENELAKILARGRGSSSSTTRPDNGKGRVLANRYGLGGASPENATGSPRGEADGAGGYSGWDEAGRTPIRLSDNLGGGDNRRKDSVAMMDSAQGRGVTSPSRTSLQGDHAGIAAAGAAGVAAGAAVGLGLGAAGGSASSVGDDGSDSDDLEYVSNPFEDED
ncbi:hypothetical protein ACQY0O_002011 [Thecaphora frezii]